MFVLIIHVYIFFLYIKNVSSTTSNKPAQLSCRSLLHVLCRNEILHLTLSHPGHSGDIILDIIAVDAFIYYLASFII